MAFIEKISCSWCGAMNDYQIGTATYCPSCGHRADVVEKDCDCRRCNEKRRLLEIREREQARKQSSEHAGHWESKDSQ